MSRMAWRVRPMKSMAALGFWNLILGIVISPPTMTVFDLA
jgi:hypothetical protein